MVTNEQTEGAIGNDLLDGGLKDTQLADIESVMR